MHRGGAHKGGVTRGSGLGSAGTAVLSAALASPHLQRCFVHIKVTWKIKPAPRYPWPIATSKG